MSVDLYQKICLVLDSMSSTLALTRSCAEGIDGELASRVTHLQTRVEELRELYSKTKSLCGSQRKCPDLDNSCGDTDWPNCTADVKEDQEF